MDAPLTAIVPMSQGTLRPMHEADLPTVTRLDAAAYPFPWTEQIFRDCMRAGYLCCVYEKEALILGYGVLALGAAEGHILNLCVSPEHQGRGIGRELLLYLIDVAKANKIETLFLEVRISNDVARHLYHRVGFNEVGIRKGYYPATDGREDAMVLALALTHD
ncbi:MAG: ribosomal protein S18-alanine N-acetyltransferase [Pseudomonadota bacterium]